MLGVDEAERYVEGLKQFEIADVGSSAWLDQHQRIVKLNLQAHQSAMARSDEFVLEALQTFNKVGVLVHELLLIEAWKEVRYSLFRLCIALAYKHTSIQANEM